MRSGCPANPAHANARMEPIFVDPQRIRIQGVVNGMLGKY
jgi:hypothetical protein